MQFNSTKRERERERESIDMKWTIYYHPKPDEGKKTDHAAYKPIK